MQSVGEINARPWDFLHPYSKTIVLQIKHWNLPTSTKPTFLLTLHIYVMNASILNPWTYYPISMESEH